MPLSEDIVLTKIFEDLETPNVQRGDVCALLFTRQSQIADSIGLRNIVISTLEGYGNDNSGQAQNARQTGVPS